MREDLFEDLKRIVRGEAPRPSAFVCSPCDPETPDVPKADEKPAKRIDEMTLSDFRTGCERIMRAPWLPY
jgi:hypothetical protein